jgi:hypothetical protein
MPPYGLSQGRTEKHGENFEDDALVPVRPVAEDFFLFFLGDPLSPYFGRNVRPDPFLQKPA